MLSPTVIILLISSLTVVSIAVPIDDHPQPEDHHDNSTFIGPIANLKQSITDLNARIQEETQKAFEEVNNKLKTGGVTSHQAALDYPTEFSNEIGKVENIKVVGLSDIQIVKVETDLFQLGTEFNVLLRNITIEGTVTIQEDALLGNTGGKNAKLIRANLIDASYEGTAGLALKVKDKKNQLIYRKFVGKQRARGRFQLQIEDGKVQQNIDSLLEDQIVKSLLLSSLDNVMKIYFSAVQKTANTNLKKIDVESYLPGDFANRFFEGISSLKSNGDTINGYDFLTALYTSLIKEFMGRQLNDLEPYKKNIRRKQFGLEGTWVYGVFTLSDGYISGLSSVSIAVGNAINGSPQPNSNGIVRFGSLVFSYKYAVDYLGMGFETGSVTIYTYGASASYTERNGVLLTSVSPADINLSGLSFSGPTNGMQTAESKNSPDWRLATMEEQMKITVRQKMATLISNGLNYVYN